MIDAFQSGADLRFNYRGMKKTVATYKRYNTKINEVS
jgi:hypothetical protein